MFVYTLAFVVVCYDLLPTLVWHGIYPVDLFASPAPLNLFVGPGWTLPTFIYVEFPIYVVADSRFDSGPIVGGAARTERGSFTGYFRPCPGLLHYRLLRWVTFTHTTRLPILLFYTFPQPRTLRYSSPHYPFTPRLFTLLRCVTGPRTTRCGPRLPGVTDYAFGCVVTLLRLDGYLLLDRLPALFIAVVHLFTLILLFPAFVDHVVEWGQLQFVVVVVTLVTGVGDVIVGDLLI